MGNLESLVIYIFVYAFSTMLFSFYKNRNTALRYLCVFLAVLIPAVFAGARYHVGTDYKVYDRNFTYIRSIPLKSVILNDTALQSTEYGFLVLTKLLTYLGSNKVVFGFLAFIMSGLVAVSLVKEYRGSYISAGYFMYLMIYFTTSFNIVRQGLALAIVFWGYKYIFKHQFGKYVLVICIAALFHYSTFIALPAYFFWNHKRNRAMDRSKFSVVLIVASFLVIFWRRLYMLAVDLGFPWIGKYVDYLKNNHARNRDFFIKALLGAVVIILYTRLNKKNEKIKALIQMYMINILIAFTGFYITFVKRLGLYYEIPAIVLVSTIPKWFERKSQYMAYMLCILAVVIYFTLAFYITGDADIIPYRVH